jgi:hypothetical protein
MNKTFRYFVAMAAALTLSGGAWAEDRLTLSANGSTLTDTDGGAGGSVSWLHNFNPNVVLGVGGEYQTLGDAQWQFGSLRGALTGGGEGRKWSLAAEAHRGTGDDETHDFTYQVAVLSASLPLYRKLSLQLEDRQIDVDTTHGNLPKIGFSLLATPALQASVAYAKSASGNLGTDLTTARLDYYTRRLHFILGGAAGSAATVVLGVIDPDAAARDIRQGFIGFSRLYSRAEFLMLGDYLEIGDSERVTLTLSCTIHIGRPAR